MLLGGSGHECLDDLSYHLVSYKNVVLLRVGRSARISLCLHSGSLIDWRALSEYSATNGSSFFACELTLWICTLSLCRALAHHVRADGSLPYRQMRTLGHIRGRHGAN